MAAITGSHAMHRLLTILILLVTSVFGQARAADLFTEEMVASTGLQVWRLAPMPAEDGIQNYIHHPVSIAYNTDSARSIQSRSKHVQYAWLQWANRCDLCASNTFNHNPNSFGPVLYAKGLQARTSYTSYERADAATMAALLSALGEDWRGVTRAAGIPDEHVISYAAAAADPERYFTNFHVVGKRSFMTATDLVVLAPAVLSSGTARVWGILCDCEFADMRPASLLTPFMVKMAEAVHARGYKLALAPNDPLGSGMTGGYCGVGVGTRNCDVTNLPEIASIVDGITMVANVPPPKGHTFRSSLDARLALFGGPKKSLMLQFVLGIDKTTLDNAREAHDFIKRNGIRDVLFSPVYDRATGERCSHTGQKIGIVLGLPPC
ncbi:hypothetical protein LJ725_22165 [Reyranella aquatilis]|jgi:hypothetical protein|uniref:Uncharacterized protein n=1 Tax=Reyranella aquatilis TaxID=2035356 RepID=A0ABS8L038_9HYPH|nr:hypothetical protein [Reyranella aquatilis]MCC8431690.1 hypothetical protein [Reyranella aquatilis]